VIPLRPPKHPALPASASIIGGLPAGVHLTVAFLIIAITITAPRQSWALYAALAFLLILISGAARVPFSHLIKRILLIEPLALGTASLALFQPDGTIIFSAIVCKSTLCIFCLTLLAAVSRFNEIIGILRKFRIPSLLITTLVLMRRYIFVLMDESLRMRRARRSRTFTCSRIALWKSLSSVVAALFVRSSERAERIFAAMCARGWKP
jgi:cobalt/nickel transport system permease protein